MIERHFWRALYDEARDAFVVEQAGWVEGEPRIEYRFSYFSGDEDAEIACLGGVNKWWFDVNGIAEGKFFAFGKYPDKVAFEAEVEGILKEAMQLTQAENLDFF